MSTDLDVGSAAAWLEEARDWAEAQLERFAPAADAHPPRLHAGMRHALLGGGKRIRPALVLALCEGAGGPREAAARAAAAVEIAHTYSLVHDDLPAMDDDDLRRGRPTCHVLWGEATAILVGDALQALAFEVLADAPSGARGVAVLARAIGSRGMVGGQELDLERASRLPGAAGISDVHHRKTAALFGASAELGALVGGLGADGQSRARAFGEELGLAFQAIDDVLDVVGDAATLGKTPGKDERLERDTLVELFGLDGARAHAERLAASARAQLDALALPRPGPARAILERVLRRRS
jgi:geranylgeranyl pyrophosphate synthase